MPEQPKSFSEKVIDQSDDIIESLDDIPVDKRLPATVLFNLIWKQAMKAYKSSGGKILRHTFSINDRPDIKMIGDEKVRQFTDKPWSRLALEDLKQTGNIMGLIAGLSEVLTPEQVKHYQKLDPKVAEQDLRILAKAHVLWVKLKENGILKEDFKQYSEMSPQAILDKLKKIKTKLKSDENKEADRLLEEGLK